MASVHSIDCICERCVRLRQSETSKVTNERTQAVAIANRLLDEPYADPDDDVRVLARQFLRAVEPSAGAEVETIDTTRLPPDHPLRIIDEAFAKLGAMEPMPIDDLTLRRLNKMIENLGNAENRPAEPQ